MPACSWCVDLSVGRRQTAVLPLHESRLTPGDHSPSCGRIGASMSLASSSDTSKPTFLRSFSRSILRNGSLPNPRSIGVVIAGGGPLGYISASVRLHTHGEGVECDPEVKSTHARPVNGKATGRPHSSCTVQPAERSAARLASCSGSSPSPSARTARHSRCEGRVIAV